MGKLEGKTVAILVTDGFEEVELHEPMEAIEREGGNAMVVSPRGPVRGWNRGTWGRELEVDIPLAQADARRFDALLLPGGVIHSDHVRMDPKAVAFVRGFFDQQKPVAAICHALWTLIEADVVRGRTLTSYPSLQTDLRNAGAHWVDREVVVDGELLTSRRPADLPAFNDAMVDLFAGAGAAAGA